MTPGVDFFRVHRGAPVKRRIALAVALVAVGGTVVGAHLIHRLGPLESRAVSLAGGITLLSGLLVGFGTLALLLFDDVWLAIRDAGVVLHDGGAETVIGWDELGDVAADDAHLVFTRRGSGDVRWYAGGAAASIASRVEEARRKGRFGLPVAAR